ncbi:hypothetical protein PM082_011614 [Marasmius tenuissimus]|nr:hypothetical protein PM082_011614 [Marasmius tenuissimus]
MKWITAVKLVGYARLQRESQQIPVDLSLQSLHPHEQIRPTTVHRDLPVVARGRYNRTKDLEYIAVDWGNLSLASTRKLAWSLSSKSWALPLTVSPAQTPPFRT